MVFNPNLHSTSPFFTLSPDLLASLYSDGQFLELNPAWESQLGLSPKDLAGASFLDQLHPEDRPKALLEIKRLSRGKQETVFFEARVEDARKEIHWIAWTFSADPQAEGWHLIGQPRTHLKRLERALEETREKFEKFSDSSSEGLAIHEKRRRGHPRGQPSPGPDVRLRKVLRNDRQERPGAFRRAEPGNHPPPNPVAAPRSLTRSPLCARMEALFPAGFKAGKFSIKGGPCGYPPSWT